MIIGLTGSIASGKSTISSMLREKGYPIIDADQVARDVVAIGTPTLGKIAVIFGEQVLLEDGSLNRDKLGSIIFNHPAERKKLNDIMHPAIRQEMLRQQKEHEESGHETIVMDIPLLFESKLQHFVDKILVVSVTEEIQLERLMKRNNLSLEDANMRIASQLPISEKVKLADAVIYNNDSLESSKKQLEKILLNWDV
ncbi:dephospho-CoA kinase [Paenisporosarcina cavernae]|uniref:Dephospho-CoA kinase n=1 Tax=Paenisporosarcina cavernae TaxID=2320858 RepID=A0A385YWB2_9BACL|nr:dephospho-CoA kinase [Paenisporosarcina cavernae]AYC29823.1 dephospho-CoA kinase [Paenisporosarcina cavernae]